MEKKLDGLKIAILATDDFEQSELFEPKKALEAVGGENQKRSRNLAKASTANKKNIVLI